MDVTSTTPRNKRSIGGKRGSEAKFLPGTEISFEVNVPAPYAAGPRELTEGEANILNQVIAENTSNNLRAKILAGLTEGEGDAAKTRDYTQEEVQALVDAYLAEYEPGVRRAGSGEPRVTDPVEKEARQIARQKAIEFVKGKGQKPADVDMAAITAKIFELHRDVLMAGAKKIVDQRNKASTGDLSLDGVDLVAKPAVPAAS